MENGELKFLWEILESFGLSAAKRLRFFEKFSRQFRGSKCSPDEMYAQVTGYFLGHGKGFKRMQSLDAPTTGGVHPLSIGTLLQGERQSEGSLELLLQDGNSGGGQAAEGPVIGDMHYLQFALPPEFFRYAMIIGPEGTRALLGNGNIPRLHEIPEPELIEAFGRFIGELHSESVTRVGVFQAYKAGLLRFYQQVLGGQLTFKSLKLYAPGKPNQGILESPWNRQILTREFIRRERKEKYFKLTDLPLQSNFQRRLFRARLGHVCKHCKSMERVFKEAFPEMADVPQWQRFRWQYKFNRTDEDRKDAAKYLIETIRGCKTREGVIQFLSDRPALVETIIKEGLTWVFPGYGSPTSHPIRLVEGLEGSLYDIGPEDLPFSSPKNWYFTQNGQPNIERIERLFSKVEEETGKKIGNVGWLDNLRMRKFRAVASLYGYNKSKLILLVRGKINNWDMRGTRHAHTFENRESSVRYLFETVLGCAAREQVIAALNDRKSLNQTIKDNNLSWLYSDGYADSRHNPFSLIAGLKGELYQIERREVHRG